VRQRIALAAKVTEKSAAILLLMALSVAVAIFLVYTSWAILHPYPLDYGEAPLVDQAVRLGVGENIYRPDLSSPPYTISNYPPLYVLILVPFLKLFGPTFLAGRAISVVSALASGIFLSLIIYSQTKNRLAAATTGLFLLANPYVTHWSGLLRIDLLALALSTAGLYILMKQPASKRGVIVGGLLLVAAIYTRQSYALAAPLAAFVGLWCQSVRSDSDDTSLGRMMPFLGLKLTPSRRRAIELAVIVGGLVLILFLFLNIVTDGGFYFNVVTANVNEFDLDQLEWHLDKLRETAPILLIFSGAFLLFGYWKVPFWPFLASYLLATFLSGLTIGKIGSNVNYFLELSAALSLVAGTVISWTNNHRFLRTALLLLLTFQVGLFTQTTSDEYLEGLLDRRRVVSEVHELEGIVANAEGTVLADEYMGLITLQERPLYIQPFEVTQLANAGVWDQTPFVENIHKKEFSLILIHHFPGIPVYEQRWTTEMLSAIDENYILSHSLADTFIYRARGYRPSVSIQQLTCPGAPWQLPTGGSFGIQWGENGLNLFAWDNENSSPVYAVADGLLMRHPDWVDAVAIQHDDPLRPGEKVWSLYADMANSSGLESFVVEDFPPGSTGVPVRAGQLLGYQGVWSGRSGWGIPVHLRFALVSEVANSAIFDDEILKNAVDPAPYLGIEPNEGDSSTYLQKLRCKEDNN
jgi:hypothetical protein